MDDTTRADAVQASEVVRPAGAQPLDQQREWHHNFPQQHALVPPTRMEAVHVGVSAAQA